MNYKELSPGKNVPTDVNMIVEIAKGGGTVKYEFDRDSGAIFVDRLRDEASVYPTNYGCIPQTLSEDGDPLDVIVIGEPVQTGAVLPVRPIGVLLMDDEKGHDVKILAVPADRLTSSYLHIQDISDLPEQEKKRIEHFFKHYKDLGTEHGKWSKTAGWQDVKAAHKYIEEAIERAKAPPAATAKPPAQGGPSSKK